jgi:hypothetical protein
MTYAELIQQVIDTAVAGTDADNNPVLKQRLETETLIDLTLQAVSAMVAGNPEIRARLEKRFSVTITNGIGALPSGLLLEYLREGSVRDSDQSMFATGNPYSRIKFATDFFTDSQLLLARYCVIDNTMYACPPGMSDYTNFSGTLTLDAPFVPTKANLNTEVDDEIANDLIEDAAARLRGLLNPKAEKVT